MIEIPIINNSTINHDDTDITNDTKFYCFECGKMVNESIRNNCFKCNPNDSENKNVT